MKSLYYLSVLLVTLLISGCGGGPEPVNNVGGGNSAITEANRPAANTKENPLAPQTPTPEATTNNAPTLTPVYKAYCAAWVKKDEAALRRIYSSDTIKDFEKNMKEEGIKTLVEYLSDDKASNELCEARNEKISGDTATAEVKTLGYPSGITVVFVKENGEWKLTNRRPEGALK